MSQSNNSNLVKRYTLLAVGTAFLLALLAPLGSYIIWILGGTMLYFVFLAIYYSPRKPKATFFAPQADQKPPTAQTTPKFSTPLSAQQKRRLIFIIFGFSAFVILMSIFLAFTGLVQSDNEALPDTDRQTLLSDPDNLDALTNIGNQFFNVGQYDSALYYYNRVLRVDAQNSSGLYNKALVYYRKQDYNQSVNTLKKCISFYPEYAEAHALLGDNFYVQNNYSEALVWYRNAYNQGARSAEILHIMGFLYEQQQNTAEAIRLYKETLQQDSSLVHAYERLAVLEPGQAKKYNTLAEKWRY
ncbi:MAG: hypothetical protein DYG99_00990 [Bacteroidetes bacterium CHB5]|nr:hypothetical protein [Bacteroidetes bacterium CHB5]